MESTAAPNTLFAFGLNHRTAPVEVREKLYLHEQEIPSFLARVEGSVSECLVLSTCNRTEIYGVTDSPDLDLRFFKDLLIEFKGAEGLVRDEHFFELISCSACQQLFSVATSMDSKVVGDMQILRQLRNAYAVARAEGSAGKVLNQLLQRAFKLGKQVYSETAIHHGAASASLAAVELAVEVFGSLRGRSALVLGAGEMARLTAEALVNKRIGKLLVSNRTRANADELVASLADECGSIEVVDFDRFKDRLDEVEIVITSTGSDEPILGKDDFANLQRRMLVVDIAVPRDVNPAAAECPDVILKNVDDLHSIVDENREKRMRDLPKVKRMITTEMVDFLTWYYTLPLMPSYEKTGVKPPAAQTGEILKIKEFLNQNVSEVHKLFAQSGGSFRDDLESHFALVRRLQSMKAETFGEPAG